MITILATIVILGVLIFVHELGHFATAKWADIEVPRFSIGLGPKMFGFTRGETEYVISWLPLGGYVRMAGMDDMEELEGGDHDSTEARAAGRDFESKSLPVRALVLAAGVIMNALFAWLLFAIIGMVWGVRESPPAVVGDVVEERVTAGAEALLDVAHGSRITAINGEAVENWQGVQEILAMERDSLRLEFANAPTVAVPVPEGDSARMSLLSALEPQVEMAPVLGRVVEESPAEAAGLQPDDRVVEVGGQLVSSWQEMVAAVEPHAGEAVEIVVEREGQREQVTIVPEPRQVAGTGRAIGRIGVGSVTGSLLDAYPRERMGPVGAFIYGAEETWRFTSLILDYLVGLFTGEASPRDVGGPILIYQATERMVQVGLDAYLNFMALFSINLAILNLLPIPILDGGQLAFLALEGIRGKPLSVEQRMRLSQVGLVLIVAIMVWALANDVLRLFGL